MCQTHRRRFLQQLTISGLLLTPIAAALAACSKSGWPAGVAEIKWDRDTCARCNMVISDPRFAAEICGGPNNTAFKFDDIGCMLIWWRDKAADHPWVNDDATTRMWIAEQGNNQETHQWLNPRTAHYIEKMSPMAYNFAAVAAPQAGSIDFNTMRQRILSKGK